MKTTSYVQAVKMAVAKAEKFGDWWVDRWRSNMITQPRISLFREI